MSLFTEVTGFTFANNGGECEARVSLTFTNVTEGKLELRSYLKENVVAPL
jgi:hypothetical protein